MGSNVPGISLEAWEAETVSGGGITAHLRYQQRRPRPRRAHIGRALDHDNRALVGV